MKLQTHRPLLCLVETCWPAQREFSQHLLCARAPSPPARKPEPHPTSPLSHQELELCRSSPPKTEQRSITRIGAPASRSSSTTDGLSRRTIGIRRCCFS